jgi:hypothetical protein
MSELGILDRTMSDAEGLMWRLENDPFLSSAFANITILDRRPDMDRLLRRMERATAAFARRPTSAPRSGSTTRRSTCASTSATSPYPSPARCASCSTWPA